MITYFARLVRLGNVLFVGAFMAIVRYCLVLPELADFSGQLTHFQFALLVLSAMCFIASGNVINDYFDVRTDSINRPERVVVDKYIDRRTVLLIHIILTLIALFAGIFVAFACHRIEYLLFCFIPVVLWLYTTQFKKVMFLGNMVVAMLVAAIALVVPSFEISSMRLHLSPDEVADFNIHASNVWNSVYYYAFFAFITNLAREIVKDIEDIEGDKVAGCHTLPIELGAGRTKGIVIFIEVVMMASLFLGLPECYYAHSFIVIVPTIALCILLVAAKTKKQYHRVSMLCKFVMFLGVVAPLAKMLQ